MNKDDFKRSLERVTMLARNHAEMFCSEYQRKQNEADCLLLRQFIDTTSTIIKPAKKQQIYSEGNKINDT